VPWIAYGGKVLGAQKLKFSSLFKGRDWPFLLLWVLFILLFFSCSSSKLPPYIAPLFPPLAVMTGWMFQRYVEDKDSLGLRPPSFWSQWPVILQVGILVSVLVIPPFLNNIRPGKDLVFMTPDRWWGCVTIPILLQLAYLFLPPLMERHDRKRWFATVYLLSVCFLCSLVFPASLFLTPYKSAYPLSQAIRRLVPPGEELYQYRISLYGIDFYNHLRTPLVDEIGELRFGMELLPPGERAHFFLTSPDFYRLCKERGGIYAVTQYRPKFEELRKNVSDVKVLWYNGAYYLLLINGQTSPGRGRNL